MNTEETIFSLISRFGFMTADQVQLFTQRKRSAAYWQLKKLVEKNLIQHFTHHSDNYTGYVLGDEGKKQVYKSLGYHPKEVRTVDLYHMTDVNFALLMAVTYPNVKDSLSEYEFGSLDVREYCHSRTPDGLIEVQRNEETEYFALEVEITRKTDHRIGKILNAYQRTFEDSSRKCKGVVIVATEPAIFEAYQVEIAKLPEEIRNRIHLCQDILLGNLDAKTFGVRKVRAENQLEKPANDSERSKTENPIISTSAPNLSC